MTGPGTGSSAVRKASVIGTGLIGASIGLALRERGWWVSGSDATDGLAQQAADAGAFDALGLDADADIVFVATPVGAIVDVARAALAACPRAVVTDVGGVKGSIVAAIDDPRFVGGHPMAGSEQIGLDGADADLFEGAAWILSPGSSTSDLAYTTVREVVSSLDAEVLTIDAARHDELVAVVSHVPHLAAATLVTVARDRAEEHRSLLRLAAGGFRDMTRIASGSPTIWPDVCDQNRTAILDTLDRLIVGLDQVRTVVDTGDREELHALLTEAQRVRRSLPSRPDGQGPHAEVRVPIPDRPGALAAVAVVATEAGINLRSVETIDTADAVGGLVALRIAVADVAPLRTALTQAGYRALVEIDPDEDDVG